MDYQNGVGRDLLLEAPPNLGARDTRQNLQASLASLAMDKTRPISFESFLESHPSVREFLPAEEQELECRRYLKLSGASEPSVLRPPNHQGHPGQPISRQEGDQDVW